VKLRAGDMVILNTALGNVSLSLFSTPEPSDILEPESNVKLLQGQVGLVVSLSSHDARSVYIITSTGSGWALGAFLRKIQ